ncbi:Putative two-component membrane permease complex subunit [Sporomusa silvacetica DSM 10669]|uniref:Two-component membrane permease complex subunit n=1 Tax=Sporomusa silvacetica DSM 10669 TaxID=1123289 RepID=A0ABZ3IPM3_9FIRM|nr:permease [Sporomusa silvacetica]OZC22263.1 putative two-component membrane permease complex subunit [Sporomusa silvacetica DSM 10669]
MDLYTFINNLVFRLEDLSITDLINFKMIFLSIIIEAMPFILLSVFVSAILHNFVSEELIRKVLPSNKYLSILFACFLGLIFPVCDCGMVPIVRRLVQKKVPIYTAVSFMLAVPIINPVVIAATYFAFKGYTDFNMVYLRLGLAFLVAFLTGILLSQFIKRPQLRSTHFHFGGCGCAVSSCPVEMSYYEKIHKTLMDACNEFFEMGKYLMLGAFFGAIAQTVISRDFLLSIGQDSVISIFTMIAFAFVISVCSSADAFIAASLIANFTPGSMLAFMVFGPMLDIKNTMMLLHAFKLRFVVLLMFIIVALCASGAFLINQF